MSKKVILRLGLLALGLFGGVVAGETALRILRPPASSGGIQQTRFPVGQLTDYTPDDECGYLPKINGEGYGAQGCLYNDYKLEKTPGRTRVLFVGDSVTHRARIIDALRKLYGEKKFEYWNAGVESFNTSQEVVLYRRYNHLIKPDLVILTFHNNDFMQTPLVYKEKGKLQLLTPLHDRNHINTWLFQYSYIYRCYVGRSWRGDQEEKAVRVAENLKELEKLVQDGGGKLRVVLLPLMKPLKDYDQGENWSRNHALAIVKQLKLSNVDLAPSLEELISEKKPVEETSGDYWHPNQWAADHLAKTLYQQDILAP
ncbi:MAG: hypothetical protein J0I12_26925 [Candidatus Eremiobacteraeota bacterium]|nr:hypothetical protein [Candidatus Eremiobacteraeota bacterium]